MPPSIDPGQEHDSVLIDSSPKWPALQVPPDHPSRRAATLATTPSQDHDPVLRASSPNPPTLQVPPTHPSRRGVTLPLPASQAHSPYNNSSAAHSRTSVATATEEPEEDIPESELRRIYENEEIDRFLRVFAREVNEVRIQPAHKPPAIISGTGTGPDQNELYLFQSPTSYIEEDEGEGDEWFKLSEGTLDLPSEMNPKEESMLKASSVLQSNKCLSATLAQDYLLPHLPERRLATDSFTLTRLRLAVQRLYLVCYPIYYPFGLRIWKLATWESYWHSAFWCTVFWSLWWYNLLLSAMFLRMLGALLRRKFLKFPSKGELLRRRKDAKHAEAMGEALQDKFDLDGGLAFKDAFRVFRLVIRGKKKRAKQTAKDTMATAEEKLEGDTADKSFEDNTDNPNDEDDARRATMNAIQDIADLHERAKNIALWRRPMASARYTLVLMLLMLIGLIPAQYLIKTATFIVASLYWFFLPVFLQLDRLDRARLPPPFPDIPTDAEYAMELIAERVALGESVLPTRAQRKSKNKHNKGSKSLDTASAMLSPTEDRSIIDDLSEDETEEASTTTDKKSRIDLEWRKLREKPIIQNLFRKDKSTGSTHNPAEMQSDIHHTYPAQHIASPGVLTLTDSELLFTVVMYSNPKIRIPLKDIRGVKKTGRLGGITLRYLKEVARTNTGALTDKGTIGQDGDSLTAVDTELLSPSDPPVMEEVDEKFRWIAGRDEVFARLVGWNGRKWRKV